MIETMTLRSTLVKVISLLRNPEAEYFGGKSIAILSIQRVTAFR